MDVKKAAVQPIYNGAGERVGQTVGLSTTHFALDVAGGLPEVIYTSDGDAYLHLPGVIVAESATGERRYLLGDGLGSIRQAVDEAGAVVVYHEFDPYGVPVADGGEPYGYTGEWWQAEVGLLHLRARWYAPAMARFMNPDTIMPDYRKPQTINPYAYVVNNPVNYTDPSGHCLTSDPGGTCSGSEPDPRDLTDWLYREMIDNAHDPTVRRLQGMNALASQLARGAACDVTQAAVAAIAAGQPVMPVIKNALVAQSEPVAVAIALHSAALYEYSQLVKDGAVWDFKDEIGIKLGPGITLCAGACYKDIEYSVPGNIHFAYMGGPAGIAAWEIQAGAGWAEINDPAHDPNNPRHYAGPYGGEKNLGPTFWDPSTWNFGDEAMDHEAVTIGIKLWEKYEDRMTRAQFATELGIYIGRLSHHAPRAYPVLQEYARDWPYPLGYFDNIGRVYKGEDRP